MSKTPADWRSVQLKDAGIWLSGGTPSTDEPRYWDGDIPWISAASMKDFHIDRSERRITELGTLMGTRLVPSGTVLFVVRGMSLKSEFRVGVTERTVAFGQDCKAIIPVPGIDGKFLALALKARSRQVLAMVDEAGHGTGRLPTDLIAKLEIGIPELAEQQRIAEILDAVDAQINATAAVSAKLMDVRAASVRSAMQAGVECYRDAEAFELYSGVQRSAGSWSLVPLSTALLGIDAGHSPNLEDTPAGPGQWGVLKVSAVGQDGFRPEENKVVHYRGLRNPALCVRQGDLLMTRANTPELVGRSCIVGETPPGLMLCDKTLRLRVDERLIPAKYTHIVRKYSEVL